MNLFWTIWTDLLIVIGITAIFGLQQLLKWQTRNRHTSMENTYKIFLRRAEQRAYVYFYEIKPEIFPNIYLMRFDTPAGELYVAYNPRYLVRRAIKDEISYRDSTWINLKPYIGVDLYEQI